MLARKLFVLAILFSLSCPPSQASLGGQEISVRSDREALNGSPESVTSKSGYTVHEIQFSGRSVREYALPNGTVFAVAWRGVSQPDLSILLGNYYQEYETASTQPEARRSRGARVIRSKNVVVEKSGHMRDIRGKAYLPDLMPPGFAPGDIR